MSDTNRGDWADKIGAPAYDSIREMVASLECDYDRLTELRDERDDHDDDLPDDHEEGCPSCGDGSYSSTPTAAGDLVTCDQCGQQWAETPDGHKRALTWAEAHPDDAEELKELEEAAGDCADQDEARQRIEEDALSVRVRSGWADLCDALSAEEFMILLTTGGPAVRIRGELDNGEPCRAWLEVQDWGKPWTQFPASGDVLLSYARVFCFDSGR